MTRAICIGECMVELRPAGDGLLTQGFAGDSYNTAVYLKRSDPALDVQFATVTGADPLSDAMRAAWAAEGVGENYAWTAPDKRPGLYLIETDAAGERRFHYWRGESAAKGWLRTLVQNGGADLLARTDLVYLSGISLAILSEADIAEALDLVRSLRGRMRIAFDPNYRPALWPSRTVAGDTLAEAMRSADIVLPSQEDLEHLYGMADPQAQAELLKGWGVGEAAITTGPGRCLLVDGGWMQAPAATAVVDTSGAGDSFNGAYLAARLAGQDPRAAALAGLTLAAKVVGSRGAIIASISDAS
jgi:2-dehydro-3-deoxygluconokinase